MRRILIILSGLLLAALPALGAEPSCAEGKAGIRCRAEAGMAEDQFELGMRYLDGHFPKENRLTGLVWLDKAAKQGHKDAGYVLKRMALDTEPGESCSTVR